LKKISSFFLLFFSRYPGISTEVPPCCSRWLDAFLKP
jgi:hypothetical protein